MTAGSVNDEPVSLVECGDYCREPVRKSVAAALELLGGAGSIAGPGQTVFLKVNAVVAAAPETARVTHPEVVRAVAEEFRKVTDRVLIGDSPGGPFTPALLKRVYEKNGLAEVARQTGAELAFDTRTVDVSLPDGRAMKRLKLCAAMVEADRLVSISKFKTHSYLNITGPIKNLYGAVPGTTKFSYHSRFDNERDFADLIVDVHLAARPAFHVVDAVDAIDGDGSRRGAIRKMGVIAAGANAFALESLLMKLVGLEMRDSLVLRAAIERGICGEGTGWFEVLGDVGSEPVLSDFRLPAGNVFTERIPALLVERLSRRLSARPVPLPEACTLCGTCVKVCPRRAVTLGEDAAVVDRRKCIRCFCCSELCEYEAIDIRTPAILRAFRRRSD